MRQRQPRERNSKLRPNRLRTLMHEIIESSSHHVETGEVSW